MASQLPLYGLPSAWEGRRETGDVGLTWPKQSFLNRRAQVNVLTLIHIGGDGVRVDVASYRVNGNESIVEHTAVNDLARRIAAEGERIETVRARVPSTWQAMLIQIADESVEFRTLTVAEEWVALGRLGDIYLLVSGSHIDPKDVHLVRVANPEMYFE
jgi:hypothetical protein